MVCDFGRRVDLRRERRGCEMSRMDGCGWLFDAGGRLGREGGLCELGVVES